MEERTVCGSRRAALRRGHTGRRARPRERLAEGVWHTRPSLERFGYDRLSDVEHASENTSYSQPCMGVIDCQNPKWAERCRRTAAIEIPLPPRELVAREVRLAK